MRAGAAALLMLLGLAVSGCRSPRDAGHVAPTSAAPGGASATSTPPAGAPRSNMQLAAAVEADAARSENEPDSGARAQLAADALRDAQTCVDLEPQDAGCLYSRGIALGLDARAHPTRASDALKHMLEALRSAEAVDPLFDDAGPARVQALVLIKAPGWPLGPGDIDAGLAAAKRAVGLRPDYPPNVLALGDALAKSGDSAAARAAYARACDLSQASTHAGHEQWLRSAQQALQR